MIISITFTFPNPNPIFTTKIEVEIILHKKETRLFLPIRSRLCWHLQLRIIHLVDKNIWKFCFVSQKLSLVSYYFSEESSPQRLQLTHRYIMRFQSRKAISFKAGTKDNWSEDGSDSCSHYSALTKQSVESPSSFSLLSLHSRISRISTLDSSFSSLSESLENNGLLDEEDNENVSHSGSHYSSSIKQSTMIPSGFSLKSLQSKVSRGASLDSSISSLTTISSRRGSFNTSFNSLQERLASRNYDKIEDDHFDLSFVLEKVANEFDDLPCCPGKSFGTPPSVDSSSCDDASLDDEEPVQSSALCHLPSDMEGLVPVMINTNDPTYATIWVKSPNSARQHLELNITPTTPKAQKRHIVRRGAIRRPPVRFLVFPLWILHNLVDLTRG